MAKKKMGGLGKGLDSLFADLSDDTGSEASGSTLLLREIEPDPEQPAEQPAEEPAATETPQPEAPAESGSTEEPAVSLPTQQQVEQAASSLYNAASTVLDAILGGSGE